MSKLIAILLFALVFTCIVSSLRLEDMNEGVKGETKIVKRCSGIGCAFTAMGFPDIVNKDGSITLG